MRCKRSVPECNKKFAYMLTSSKFDDIKSCYQLAAIALAAILSFCGNIDGDFVFDDREAILQNQAVQSIIKIFDTDFWGFPIRSSRSHKSYRPLTTITFA
ncbi:unnamed protein product [Thelazia callipaeda]|uniref:Ion_trans domain-containing protein n=1 Tax=Thelazia callipaeda TaxID=103827 RepID=A0A0N5CKN0_THECL|nr:unnamed protein product [Thelazia callipaeda]